MKNNRHRLVRILITLGRILIWIALALLKGDAM